MGRIAVLVVAVRLGEMNQIHPVPRQALSVMRAGQQAVDETFVSIGCGVAQEPRDLVGRRRQAEQIKRQPANQGAPVGLERGLQTVFHELG